MTNCEAPTKRFAAVDFLKAAAIVGVVVNHALPYRWDPRATALDETLRLAVAFHVPTFLLVSGFLYAPTGFADPATVRRRLVRIVVPYLVASAVVELLGMSGAHSVGDVAFQLVTGSALPIYYYVFVLTISVLVTWALTLVHARATDVALVAVWLYLLLAAVWPELRQAQGFFWAMRNPLYSCGYFLAGWAAASRWPALARLEARHRGLVRLACLAAIAGYALFHLRVRTPTAPALGVLVRAAYTFAVAVLVTGLAAHRRASPAVRFLSDASYPLYLYHYPFVMLAAARVPPLPEGVRVSVLVAAGLLGAGLVAAAGARLLGARARLVLG